MRFSVLFLCAFLCSSLAAQKDKAVGFWYGQLEIMGTQHEILLHVQNQTNNKGKPIKDKYDLFLLYLDDSTKMPYEFSEIVISKNLFSFKIASLNASYIGKPSANFSETNGTFKQHGASTVLKLERTRRTFVTRTNRPQTPKPPFSYVYKELNIKHLTEDFELAGTLVLPKDTSMHYPIVILVSGSGAQDRDNTILEHKSFAVIADYLAKNGIASFRFDDRGVGKSGGQYELASLTDLSLDAESVFTYLKKQESSSGRQIGFLGHSEGAMHSWMVTKRRKDVDFLISLAGPARLGREIIETQQQDIVYKSTHDQKKAAFNGALFIGILDILERSEDIDYTDESLREFIKAMHKNAPKSVQDDFHLETLLQTLPQVFNNAWGREFILWNPSDYVPNYTKPVLYLIGAEDIQVKAKTNLESFKKLQNNESEAISTVKSLSGLNHLLQKCNECTVQEYGVLEETISEEVLKVILNFCQGL